jgi:hypothetical protein
MNRQAEPASHPQARPDSALGTWSGSQ